MTHNRLKKTALSKKNVKAEYNALDPEFSLLRAMLLVRQKEGLSQAQVAERMGTKSPSVTRLESSLSSGRHSPSLDTIKKYAKALNCHVEIKLVHN